MNLTPLSAYGCFITGTDTDAGKTTVTAALLRALQDLGCVARAVKPVQTGCSDTLWGLRAPDLQRYTEASGQKENCVLHRFQPACSPHLAAELAGVTLNAHMLAAECRAACTRGITLFEGAGGLFVPLNRHETMLDLITLLHIPVLLVVGNRLGCLNHALLSLHAMQSKGLSVMGMVLCHTRPSPHASASSSDTTFSENRLLRDNATMLSQFGEQEGVPLLAELPFLPALSQPNSEVPAGESRQLTSTRQAWAILAQRLLPVARLLLEQQRAASFSSSISSTRGTEAIQSDTKDTDAQESLLDFDRNHLWHPYTSAVNPFPVHEVIGTEGTHIQLRDGRQLIDGMSSWWCAIHGYRHPALIRALSEQMNRFPHIMFGGLTHEPAVELGRRLLSLLPNGLTHLFFADSGSVAVEVAIKMAIQYWKAKGKSDKTRLAALRGGYHGDTLGAMSVCDPVTGMHTLFSGLLPSQMFVERPRCRFDTAFDPTSFSPMQELLYREHRHLAAVIVEPIVQGAGGMWFYHPEYLRCLRQLCTELDILLITDEIATGFGRTGKLFASEWADITPDILCLGKALTGGTMTLAATAVSTEVAYGISSTSAAGKGVFMHGPTFMGNALACSVACASIDLLLASPWQQRIKSIEEAMTSGLSPCLELPDVADVRTLGAIGVVEMRHPVNVERLQSFFVRQGVWIRPFGKTIYLMPPYIMVSREVNQLTKAIFHALSEGIHV